MAPLTSFLKNLSRSMMMKKIPVILPLKGGTMNVLASHLNIPSNPYKALKDLKNGYKTTQLFELS